MNPNYDVFELPKEDELNNELDESETVEDTLELLNDGVSKRFRAECIVLLVHLLPLDACLVDKLNEEDGSTSIC